MGLLDQILGHVGSNVDVANLAEKVGLSTEQVEQAVAMLGRAHQAKGDTIETAAANTGLSTDVISQIVNHIGGEGSLSKYAALLDQDGDGNPLDDIAKVASKIFGK